jgi:2,3-bisphosphoglycerate-dependent phosphoglycerate mutase
MTASLVLVRHGQSEWNKKNLFTGWKNPDLTTQGINEATSAGIELKDKDYQFDIMFTSDLLRAQKTGEIILEQLGVKNLPIVKHQALNERNYGDLSGLNKDEARKKWGDEQVHIWRRSFDTPPPGGESLKDTSARVLPYFKKEILPQLLQGNNVLITAHGNSLRSLVMELDQLTKEQVIKLEIATGVPIYYEIKASGEVTKK